MATRRVFLKSIPLFSGAMALGINTACHSNLARAAKDVGIQLWTVRDDIKVNLNASLKALADMGYRSIEAYDFDGKFYGRNAVDFSSYIHDLGMKLISSHTGITGENAAEYAEIAAKAGLEYLILPSLMGRPSGSTEDFRRLAEEMNHIGENCKNQGIKFGYHNHDFEFRLLGVEFPYDILLSETDPEFVSFQPDIYWMVKAGKNPLDYFVKYPGRFSTWHIKDKGNDGDSCIVGNGVIDYKTLLEHQKTAGMERIIVEQEHYTEGPPLYCAGQSLNYIQNHLF